VDIFLVKYIYSFHMPLFFFIAGLVFCPEKYQGPKELITRKISTLLLPYFFFCFAAYVLSLFFRDARTLSGLFDSLFVTIDGNAYHLGHTFNPTLWFLPCLFLVTTEFYFISFLKKGVRMVVVGFLVAMGFILGSHFKHLPWTVAGSLVDLLFFGFGFLLKDKILPLRNPSKLIIIFFGVVVSAIFCYLNGPISLGEDCYGNPIYFMLSSLAGISFVTLLTFSTKPNKILSYIGANSIIILGFHGPLFLYLRNGTQILFKLRALYTFIPVTPIIFLLARIFTALLLTLVQFIIISPLIPVFNKNLYFILGRKKQKERKEITHYTASG